MLPPNRTTDFEGLEREERHGHGRVKTFSLRHRGGLVLEHVEVTFELLRVLVCQELSGLQKACHLGRLGEDPADQVLALSRG